MGDSPLTRRKRADASPIGNATSTILCCFSFDYDLFSVSVYRYRLQSFLIVVSSTTEWKVNGEVNWADGCDYWSQDFTYVANTKKEACGSICLANLGCAGQRQVLAQALGWRSAKDPAGRTTLRSHPKSHH